MRRLLFILVLIFLSLSCASKKNKVETEKINLPGLSSSVTVYYDRYMIPHIYGKNIYDVIKVQGYIQAQERLFIMDVFRRLAMGRLSELLGDFAGITISLDSFIRAIFTAPNGMKVYDFVEQQMKNSQDPEDEKVYAIFKNFVEGINIYLRELKKGKNLYFPPEYKLFEITPADIPYWEVRDILAVARLFTFTLSESFDWELAQSIRYEKLKDQNEKLMLTFLDPRPITNAFTLPYFLQDHWQSAGAPSFMSLGYGLDSVSEFSGVDFPSGALKGLSEVFRILKGLKDMYLGILKDWGSNNFVVSGKRSATGYAYLANDPHLQLMTPPIFYEFHLAWGGDEPGNVAGVTFSGTPGVIVGHNENIAWGVTVVGYDVSDIYAEKITVASDNYFACYDANRNRICEKDEYSVPVSFFTDVVNVRNYPDKGFHGVEIKIPYIAKHGPVIFLDSIPAGISLFVSVPTSLSAAGFNAISLKWTGMQPSNEAKTFLLLDTAKDFDDFKHAVNFFEVGAQNFVYADVNGHIGYYPHAYVPIRPSYCNPGLIMDGSGWCEWQGRIPDDELPQVTTPEDVEKYEDRGFICTANNDQIGQTYYWTTSALKQYLSNPASYPYKYYLYTDTAIGFREGEITELLEKGVKEKKIDFAYMQQVQGDNHSLFGRYFVPLLLKLLQSDRGNTLISNLSSREQDRVREALSILSSWDYSTPTGTGDPFGMRKITEDEVRNSVAAALFHAWVKRFIRYTLSDECSYYQIPCVGTGQGAKIVYYALIATSEEVSATYDDSLGYSRIFDNLYSSAVTETPEEIALEALLSALDFWENKVNSEDFIRYRWGIVHQAIFLNPFIFRTRGPYPNDGGDYTIDVANTPSDGVNFTQMHGPAMRFVVELRPGKVKAENVLPGTNPGYYEIDGRYDQMPLWLHNEYRPMPFYPEEVRKAAVKVIEFLSSE